MVGAELFFVFVFVVFFLVFFLCVSGAQEELVKEGW